MSKSLNRILREAKRHPAFAGCAAVARARAIWRRGLRHPRGMIGAACVDHTGLIQVNAALRRSRVPAFVPEYLVHHELCHLLVQCDPPILGGPVDGHCRALTEVTALHPCKEAAEAWLMANLGMAGPSSGFFGLIRRVA